jgi:hypothetical protein
MHVNTSVHPEDFIISSRNTRPTMMVETILTSRVLVVEEPQYLELMVNFYPQAVNLKNPSKLRYKLVMPKDWTPRMYLGALNQSIKNNTVLSLESVAMDRQSYATTNKVHWLFSSPLNVIHTRLTTSAAYIHVVGGNYQSKSP